MEAAAVENRKVGIISDVASVIPATWLKRLLQALVA